MRALKSTQPQERIKDHMSRTKTMSLNEALTEVKHLKGKISEKIYNSILVGVVTGDKNRPTDARYPLKDELEKKITADYQSVTDLMDYRLALKAAISDTNHKTKVQVGSNTMSIADAILLKQAAEDRLVLLRQMQSQMSQASTKVAQLEDVLRRRVDQQITEITSKKTDKSDVSAEVIKAIRTDAFSDNEPKLLNPLDLNKKIAKLEEELQAVGIELDHRLSTANATTMLTVTWGN